MPEQDPNKEKRSAFVEDEKINRINRTLRSDAVIDKEKILTGNKSSHAYEYHFDSNKSIIKSEDFQIDSKPFIIGGTIDPQIKEPEVEVIKDADGNVTKIKVKCTCGREVDIGCVY